MLVTDAGSPSGRERRSSAQMTMPAPSSAAAPTPAPIQSTVVQPSDDVTPTGFDGAGTRPEAGCGSDALSWAVALPAVSQPSVAFDATVSHPSVTATCGWTVTSLDTTATPDPCTDAA